MPLSSFPPVSAAVVSLRLHLAFTAHRRLAELTALHVSSYKDGSVCQTTGQRDARHFNARSPFAGVCQVAMARDFIDTQRRTAKAGVCDHGVSPCLHRGTLDGGRLAGYEGIYSGAAAHILLTSAIHRAENRLHRSTAAPRSGHSSSLAPARQSTCVSRRLTRAWRSSRPSRSHC